MSNSTSCDLTAARLPHPARRLLSHFSIPRDWDAEHRRLLEEAEEWDLLEWFTAELKRRTKGRLTREQAP